VHQSFNLVPMAFSLGNEVVSPKKISQSLYFYNSILHVEDFSLNAFHFC